jgi:hypothetical protein
MRLRRNIFIISVKELILIKDKHEQNTLNRLWKKGEKERKNKETENAYSSITVTSTSEL